MISDGHFDRKWSTDLLGSKMVISRNLFLTIDCANLYSWESEIFDIWYFNFILTLIMTARHHMVIGLYSRIFSTHVNSNQHIPSLTGIQGPWFNFTYPPSFLSIHQFHILIHILHFFLFYFSSVLNLFCFLLTIW